MAPEFSLGLTVKKLSSQFDCEILFKKTGPDSSWLSPILQGKKERMNDKVLLCSTGTCIQDPVINITEENIKKKKNVYVCITESLCYTAVTDSIL